MANEKDLEYLRQGVKFWNRLREEDPWRAFDLSEARFHRKDLSRVNLSMGDLNRTDFGQAILRGANLQGTNLFLANLSETDLSEADLSRSDLREANLSRANLFNANLSGCRIGRTIFVDIDLRTVKGLKSIYHTGPSSIGIDTIYCSGGKIPEKFLRGVGIPDTLITYMASITGEAIQYYSCFISYSHQDEKFAQRLHADLQDNGVRCWFAPEDMKIGDKIRPRVDESIRIHDKLLVVLSENSMQSDWVEDEVETAIEEEKKRKTTVLFPIRLDETVMDTKQAWAAKLRRTCHIGDFSGWKDHDEYQRALERLLRDLKAEG